LNEATDEASRVVEMVETFLNDECSLGLAAEIVVDSIDIVIPLEDDDEYTDRTETVKDFTSLAYERYGPKFRIVVKEDRRFDRTADGGADDFQWQTVNCQPWASSPRAMKLETFPSLGDLLKEVSRKAEAAIESTVKTSKAVQELVQALKPSAAKPASPVAAGPAAAKSGPIAAAFATLSKDQRRTMEALAKGPPLIHLVDRPETSANRAEAEE
jgi:hypothetical protein